MITCAEPVLDGDRLLGGSAADVELDSGTIVGAGNEAVTLTFAVEGAGQAGAAVNWWQTNPARCRAA